MAAEIHEEILINLENKPGAVAKVLKSLGAAGVNVRALCGYGMGPDRGVAHVIADNPAKAKAALDAAKAQYQLSPALVVAIDDKPGAAAAICEKIAAKGVNIEHCYSTAMGSGKATFVIRTTDNGRAKEAIG